MPENTLGVRVRTAMKVNPALLAVADNIGIDESHGVVTLSGTVPTREVANTCELIAAGVADVAGVENYLVCEDEPQEPKPAGFTEETVDPLQGTVPSAALNPAIEDSSGSVQGMLSTMSTLGGSIATRDTPTQPRKTDEPQEPKPAGFAEETVDPLQGTVPSAALDPATNDSSGSVQGMLSTMSTLGGSTATGDTLAQPRRTDEAQEPKPADSAEEAGHALEDTAPSAAAFPAIDDSSGSMQSMLSTMSTLGESAATRETLEPPKEPVEPGPIAPSHGVVLGQTSGQFNVPSVPGMPSAPGVPGVPSVPSVPNVPGENKPEEPRVPRQPRETGPVAPSHGMVLGDTSGTFTAPALPRVGGHLNFDREVEEARREAAERPADDKLTAPPGAVISEADYSGSVLLPADPHPPTDDDEATEKKPATPGEPVRPAVPEHVNYDINTEAGKPK